MTRLSAAGAYRMVDLRTAAVSLSGLVTGLSLGAARLVVDDGPLSWHPAAVTRWYQQHESLLGWRVVLVATAAAGLVAFASSFRETTWSTAPQWLWIGTVMVLAALGYAAMSSAAAASELATLGTVRSTSPASEVVRFGAHAQRSLLVLATPALVVVLMCAIPPLVRRSVGGQVAAVAALGVSMTLAIPAAWRLGHIAAATWFLLVSAVMIWPGSPRGTTAEEPIRPRPDGGGRALTQQRE